MIILWWWVTFVNFFFFFFFLLAFVRNIVIGYYYLVIKKSHCGKKKWANVTKFKGWRIQLHHYWSHPSPTVPNDVMQRQILSLPCESTIQNHVYQNIGRTCDFSQFETKVEFILPEPLQSSIANLCTSAQRETWPTELMYKLYKM